MEKFIRRKNGTALNSGDPAAGSMECTQSLDTVAPIFLQILIVPT